MTPKAKLMIAIPVIAVVVAALAYFRLFTNPLVIALIFALWVAVSLRNRRKFRRQDGNSGTKALGGQGGASLS